MSTNKQRLVVCPQCKGPAVYGPENKFRPFCSERCQLMDLGQWASEGYRIAQPLTPDDANGDDPTRN